MIAMAKTVGTKITNLIRVISVRVFGLGDIREANEATPYGVDSSPVKGINAYYSNTSVNGQQVVIGYQNKHQKSLPGETRLFSTTGDGSFSYNVWVKSGKVLIGNSDEPTDYANYLTRFNELKTGFDTLKSDFNTFVTVYNTHVHPGVTTGAGSTTATLSTGAASDASIDDSKAETIQVI